MSSIKFVNPEVDAAYEVVGEKDVIKVFSGHYGPISKINVKTAQALVKAKSPHIKLKEGSAPAAKKEIKAPEKPAT